MEISLSASPGLDLRERAFFGLTRSAIFAVLLASCAWANAQPSANTGIDGSSVGQVPTSEDMTAPSGSACHPLVVATSGTLVNSGGGHWRYRLAEGQLGGGAATDSALLDLYSASTGTFDLAAGLNTDLATCNQCFELFQDVVNGVTSKVFFQDRGLLNLTVAPGANLLPFAAANLRLVEVTLDPNTGHSTPVPGGECYVSVSNQIFSSGFD